MQGGACHNNAPSNLPHSLQFGMVLQTTSKSWKASVSYKIVMQPKGEIKYQVFMNVVIYLAFYHRLLLKVLLKMQSHKIHPRNSPWWYFKFRLQWQRTWWPPTNIRNKLCIVWIKSNRYKRTVQTMNKMADPTTKKNYFLHSKTQTWAVTLQSTHFCWLRAD